MGAGWIFYRQIKKNLERYITFRDGRGCEEKVVEKLRMSLDNRWTIFRNLTLPNRKDDLDILLVGPGGVWTLEVKAYRPTVRIVNGKWEMQNKGRWSGLWENPSTQVTQNATRLNDFLQRNGITRFVERAIVLDSQPVSNFENSKIPIWLVSTIDDRASTLTTKLPPDEKENERIVRVLKKRAEELKAEEKAKG